MLGLLLRMNTCMYIIFLLSVWRFDLFSLELHLSWVSTLLLCVSLPFDCGCYCCVIEPPEQSEILQKYRCRVNRTVVSGCSLGKIQCRESKVQKADFIFSFMAILTMCFLFNRKSLDSCSSTTKAAYWKLLGGKELIPDREPQTSRVLPLTHTYTHIHTHTQEHTHTHTNTLFCHVCSGRDSAGQRVP